MVVHKSITLSIAHQRNRSYRELGACVPLAFDPNDYSTSERKALDIINDHMRELVLAIKELRALAEAWTLGNIQEVDASYERLNELERSADEIRISLLSEVSKAGPGLLLREDILRFLDIDKMVDAAVGGAFYIYSLKDWRPPKDLSEKFLEMVDISIELVTQLKSAIYNVFSNPDNAIKFAREIDFLEKRIDKLYRPLILQLTELKTDLKKVMGLREFILRVDEIADIGLEIADAVRVLVLTR